MGAREEVKDGDDESTVLYSLLHYLGYHCARSISRRYVVYAAV